MVSIKTNSTDNSSGVDEIIGIIRSAIVFGPSEKHYDIVFTKKGIRIVYLGEYKYARLKQFLGKGAELQIYRILRSKRRVTSVDDVIEISNKDIVSIRIEKPQRRNMDKSKTVRKEKSSNLVMLEIRTRSNKYSFYINAKIYQIAKKIINKYIKSMQETG